MLLRLKTNDKASIKYCVHHLVHAIDTMKKSDNGRLVDVFTTRAHSKMSGPQEMQNIIIGRYVGAKFDGNEAGFIGHSNLIETTDFDETTLITVCYFVVEDGLDSEKYRVTSIWTQPNGG